MKYDLGELIGDVHNLIKFRAQAKELNFVVEVDSTLPTVLRGDDIHLKQILTNLLTNAVKYTHKGTVRFSVAPHHDGIRFSVKDTGIGIKQEDISRLFNAFDRIEETRNRSIEGTGLGLNITWSLLRMLGSELHVDSVYGKGSEFWFVLEQEVVDETPIGLLQLGAREHHHKAYSVGFTAPNASILVVDDNDINRKVFTKLLKKTKVRITEASGGMQSVELAQEQRFDIIFMDHMMPEMDGIEALKAIRSDADGMCREVPVIALTANAVLGAEELYLSKGFDGFLSKPIEPDKLEDMVYSLLDDSLLLPPDESGAAPAEQTQTAEEFPEQESVELPQIEGINWAYAMYHLKDKQLLNETLALFVTAMESEAAALDGFFDRLSEEGADSYRVKVHSMKSSAAMLGIFTLAGMALELEKAAKNSDLDTIRAMHAVFIRRWLSYREPLAELVGSPSVDDGDKLPAAQHMAEVHSILAQIRCGAEEMDVDLLDEMSERLNAFSYDDSVAARIAELQALILNFEVEKLVEFKL